MADEIPGIDFDSATFDPTGDEKSGPESAAPNRTRKPRSDKGVPRGSRAAGTTTTRRSATSSARLAEQLSDPIAKLAMGLAFQSPTASAVMITRADETAKALVAIAENHPRMLAALQKVSKVGPASDLLQTAAMLVIALQVDFGRLPPEHPLAAASGVTSLFAQTHPVETPEDNNTPGFFGTFTPPPGFGDGPPGPNNPGHPMYSFRAQMGANRI